MALRVKRRHAGWLGDTAEVPQIPDLFATVPKRRLRCAGFVAKVARSLAQSAPWRISSNIPTWPTPFGELAHAIVRCLADDSRPGFTRMAVGMQSWVRLAVIADNLVNIAEPYKSKLASSILLLIEKSSDGWPGPRAGLGASKPSTGRLRPLIFVPGSS
jgi:hypothetical protein